VILKPIENTLCTLLSDLLAFLLQPFPLDLQRRPHLVQIKGKGKVTPLQRCSQQVIDLLVIEQERHIVCSLPEEGFQCLGLFLLLYSGWCRSCMCDGLDPYTALHSRTCTT